VNGVAELHSGLVAEMFADFVDFFGRDHFTNVTNGITARRWLLQCNPALSTLITNKLGNDDWVLDLYKLKELEKFAKDLKFQKEWDAVKQSNKDRLATYIELNLGIPVNVSRRSSRSSRARAELTFTSPFYSATPSSTSCPRGSTSTRGSS
jgi:glycogen phosphorylase